MKLVGPAGASFDLAVVRYQFPEATEFWDANWLLVRGKVQQPEGGWSFVDPCLTTCELAELASWFESIAAGPPTKRWCVFTEPNLAFEYIEVPEPSVAITFSHESAPSRIAGRARIRGLVVTFPLAANDPREAAGALRAMLNQHPVRSSG